MTTPLRPRTAAGRAWFEKNNGGCVHFDKGFGPYAQCEDPDVGVPIRALDQVCEAEAASDIYHRCPNCGHMEATCDRA